MPPLAYTVVATIPDPDTLARYIHWLLHGHIQAVVRGGASTAEVLGPDLSALPASGPFRVETRYTFPTPDAFRSYEENHAPTLRADGSARFGGVLGMTFTRQTATVLGRVDVGSGTTS
jgi:hypothetical protein